MRVRFFPEQGTNILESEGCDEKGFWVPWNEQLTSREHYEEWRMLQLEAVRRDSEKRTESALKRDLTIGTAALVVSGVAVIATLVLGGVQIWVNWQQLEESRAATAEYRAASAERQSPSVPSPSQPQLVPPPAGQPSWGTGDEYRTGVNLRKALSWSGASTGRGNSNPTD